MRSMTSQFRIGKIAAVAAIAAGLCAWSGPGQSQSLGLPGLPSLTGLPAPSGSQASAAQVAVWGTVSSLTGTGLLTSPSAPLSAGDSFTSIAGTAGSLSAEALHATTMGWTDQVASQASLTNLSMTIGGISVLAESIASQALTSTAAGSSAESAISGLVIGGVPVWVSGAPNQAVSVPGLSVILNQQVPTATGIAVNALRITTLDGLTDVAIAASSASL